MPKPGKKAKGKQVKQGRKKKKEPLVVGVAAQIRKLTKSKAETTEKKDSKVLALANGLSEETLRKESKEAYFIEDISYILKSVRCISSVKTEQNTLELQLKLEKKLACARLRSKALKRNTSVLHVVLWDNLNNPHCVGKLQKVLQLCGQENLLRSERMNKIWAKGLKKNGTQKVLTMLCSQAKEDHTLSGLALNVYVNILQLFCARKKQKMVQKNDIIRMITKSLCTYMDHAKKAKKAKKGTSNPSKFCVACCCPHIEEVQIRLNCIWVILRNDCFSPAKLKLLDQVWECLVKHPVIDHDQETGFKWFGMLVTDDHGPHLQPDEVRTFVDKVMELEPSNLTDQGLSCFDSLTCCMESRDKQKLKLASIYLLKVICAGKESVARKAITSVIPKLRTKLGGHESSRLQLKDIDQYAQKNELSKLKDYVGRILKRWDKQPADVSAVQPHTQAAKKLPISDEQQHTPIRPLDQCVRGKTKPPRKGPLFPEDEQPTDVSAEQPHTQAAEKKTASLSVRWQSDSSPPKCLREFLPRNQQWSSALVHRTDSEQLLQLVPKIARGLEKVIMTFSVMSPTDNLPETAANQSETRKREIMNDAFRYLRTENYSMELGADCKEYIAVYSGKGYKTFGKRTVRLDKLKNHPLFEDVKKLSDSALATIGCSETVTTRKNVIYAAILNLNEIPVYYIGKASGGIKNRWGNGHCTVVNNIIRCLERVPDAFETVIHHPPSDLAVAGAVMKQVATRGADGVAVFAIDFCPAAVIDDHEQHYITAFADLFPETEGKLKCLNVQQPKKHYCGTESLKQCSTEVAVSLLLHDCIGPMN